MVGVVFVYVDTVYGFLWVFFFMLSSMLQHDYLDTYCFECLICMCFVFLYLQLFSAIEHVSHGKALYKYAHYYYYHYDDDDDDNDNNNYYYYYY